MIQTPLTKEAPYKTAAKSTVELELAGDAWLRTAIKSSSPGQTLFYAGEALAAYELATYGLAQQTSAQHAFPQLTLAKKIQVAGTLERSVRDSFVNSGTEAAKVQLIFAFPNGYLARVLIAQIQSGKQITSTNLSDMVADADYEFEIAQILTLGRELNERADTILRYTQAANYFGGFQSYDDYRNFVQALRDTLKQLDEFLPLYIHLQAEQPAAANAANKAMDKTPEDFLKFQETVVSLLSRT